MARTYSKTTRKTGAKTRSSKTPTRTKSRPSTRPRSEARPARKKKGGIKALLPRAQKAGKSRKTREPRPISTGMSLDRKLDLTGILMALVGLLTLLAMLSAANGPLTGGWVSVLGRGFGWGAFIFPIAVMIIGLWLVLRNFERIPQFSVQRTLGVLLLFLCTLTAMHYFANPQAAQIYPLAGQMKGGGYVGGFLYFLLFTYLGRAGTLIALVAWLIISLALFLDVSVADLFRWIPPLFEKVQDWIDDRRSNGSYTPLKGVTPPEPAVSMPVSRREHAVQPAQNPPAADAAIQPRTFTPNQNSVVHTWILPSVQDILEPGSEVSFDDEIDRHRAAVIEETLASFGAPVNVVEINRGPTITQFGVEPDFVEGRTGRVRVRVSKIASLADDLALALSARRIRVEAPVPGKGYVGIEVPNDQIALVALRDVIESEAFRRLRSPLRFALGQDVAGSAAAADLAAMPHLLIAGATGSGKSVCVNTVICCLLLNNSPDDLRLVMVDPKRVELTGYNGIPHLLAPVVVEMERVVGALQWILREMDQRYRRLAQVGCRNINDFNAKVTSLGEKKMPHMVVLIDELADLMMLAPDETEKTITRLAQLARATGIHLVIATQRPSTDVVTGLIKANFPSRIAFAVASNVDSRVILDQPGAERLLGRGDMLFQAPDSPAPVRLQGAFVSDPEIQRLVSFWTEQAGVVQPGYASAAGQVDAIPAGVPLKQIPLWEEMEQAEASDPLLNEAIDLVRRQGRASISMLQRRLRIGYTRSARIVETMQEKGIIGTEPGPQGFEVLDYGPAAPPADED